MPSSWCHHDNIAREGGRGEEVLVCLEVRIIVSSYQHKTCGIKKRRGGQYTDNTSSEVRHCQQGEESCLVMILLLRPMMYLYKQRLLNKDMLHLASLIFDLHALTLLLIFLRIKFPWQRGGCFAEIASKIMPQPGCRVIRRQEGQGATLQRSNCLKWLVFNQV